MFGNTVSTHNIVISTEEKSQLLDRQSNLFFLLRLRSYLWDASFVEIDKFEDYLDVKKKAIGLDFISHKIQ